MNAKQLTAAFVLFTAAGAALAEAPYPPETKFESTKSRAEVIAELKQAQAQGVITNGNDYPIVIQARTLASEKTVSQAADPRLYTGA